MMKPLNALINEWAIERALVVVVYFKTVVISQIIMTSRMIVILKIMVTMKLRNLEKKGLISKPALTLNKDKALMAHHTYRLALNAIIIWYHHPTAMRIARDTAFYVRIVRKRPFFLLRHLDLCWGMVRWIEICGVVGW
jgi:hypothetical protein